MEISQRERNILDSEKVDSEKDDKKDSKTEGISGDIANTLEPLLRAGEKLFDLDRRAVGTWLIKGALKGNMGGIDGLFGKPKKTRIEKFKEVFEVVVWLLLLVMIFFWINYGVARWMGVVR